MKIIFLLSMFSIFVLLSSCKKESTATQSLHLNKTESSEEIILEESDLGKCKIKKDNDNDVKLDEGCK